MNHLIKIIGYLYNNQLDEITYIIPIEKSIRIEIKKFRII